MYNPKIHHRRSIRIKEYDYSKSGMYFITICTQNGNCILSEIDFCSIDNKIKTQNIVGAGFHPCPIYTNVGNEIERTIMYINKNYTNIEINDYVIMPNHIHLIIEIKGRGGTLPLQRIIGNMKSYTTKKYNEIYRTKGKHLWQRNYYEHIIRNEKEYLKILEYIQTNPYKWKEDTLYNKQ